MIKIVKVILEKEDIIELIKTKYPTAEVVSGLDKDIEVLIRVTELIVTKNSVDVHATIPPQIIRDEHGNVDADKSGLTLKNRPKTVPGGAMGRERGKMKVF